MKENISKYCLDREEYISEKEQESIMIYLDLLQLRNEIAKKGFVCNWSICRHKLHSIKKFQNN